MSLKKTILVSLLLTLVVWLFFSWPLPLFAKDGIPSSAANIEQGSVRRMFQGDHLQLLYNYWLTADMLGGGTPWFHNVYEFNTGDDSARKYVGIDDAPFVFLFTLGYWAAGRAAGWNLTGFVALWLTHLFTWLLLRRYLKSDLAAGILALIAIALPYRWTSLFGGSPTGYAMTWIPMLMWGLDAMIRRNRIAGGVLAGLAVVFASWNDAHVFFFGVLFVPCWALVVLLMDRDIRWAEAATWKRWILAALPFVVLVLAVLIQGQMKHSDLSETTFESGKSFSEVALYSPKPHGLTSWRAFGHESQIYIGYLLPAFVVVGLLLQFVSFVRSPREQWRRTLVFALVAGGMAAAIALALGTKGPMDARLLVIARKLIPPYAMIRQPAKIFCILPTVFAFAAALSFDIVTRKLRSAAGQVAAAVILVGAVAFGYGMQIRPTVCLLDTQQGAYAAVAADAAAREVAPRAIILPIWPGDSSWASLYEHYVSLYRIRMINGYQPAVPREYIEQVFNVFESFNCGLLSEFQRSELKKRGIDYVLLHEDAFPEKVSWFPVAFTIKKLLNHPHLELLKQDRNVWAFRILDEPVVKSPAAEQWNIFFPNMHHEMEWSVPSEDCVRTDQSASDARFAHLDKPGVAIALRPFEHLQAHDARLLLRCRGNARLVARIRLDDADEVVTRDVRLESENWDWVSVPLPEPGDSVRFGVEFALESGAADLDLLLFASGELPKIVPGESFTLPAPLFFHAGYTDLAADSVRFRADYEPADGIFYGPKLPLARGEYRVTLDVENDAAPGTALGYFHIEPRLGRPINFPVVAGTPAEGRFTAEDDLPFVLRFFYNRRTDMAIRGVTFTRLGAP